MTEEYWEKKADQIAHNSAINNATHLVVAHKRVFQDDAEMKAAILHWAAWFYDQIKRENRQGVLEIIKQMRAGHTPDEWEEKIAKLGLEDQQIVSEFRK